MKGLILALLTMAILQGVSTFRPEYVAGLYQRNMADQLDPSYPKLA